MSGLKKTLTLAIPAIAACTLVTYFVEKRWPHTRLSLDNLALTIFGVWFAITIIKEELAKPQQKSPIINSIRKFLGRKVANRIAAGLCTICGYSLTGNVSGTCPECGRKIG